MRLSSTEMQDRKMTFAIIPSICASCSKKISIYNEEMIVARCFVGFLIFSQKSLGKTFKVILDGRIESIQEESQQFPNPNELIPPESNEQQQLLRVACEFRSRIITNGTLCAKVRKDSTSFVMRKPKRRVSNTSKCHFFPSHLSSGRYSHRFSLLSE